MPSRLEETFDNRPILMERDRDQQIVTMISSGRLKDYVLSGVERFLMLLWLMQSRLSFILERVEFHSISLWYNYKVKD